MMTLMMMIEETIIKGLVLLRPTVKEAKKGQQTAKNKAKKKKSLKDEFQMDIKDMIVKKRLASLNASAIMSASYAQERPKDAQDSHALVPYSASEAAISLASASAAAASSSATV